MMATALITVSGSIMVALVGWVVSHRKTSAETNDINVDTAIKVVGVLRSEMELLRQEQAKLRERVALLEQQRKADQDQLEHLERGVAALTEQVIELGHEPRWTST